MQALQNLYTRLDITAYVTSSIDTTVNAVLYWKGRIVSCITCPFKQLYGVCSKVTQCVQSVFKESLLPATTHFFAKRAITFGFLSPSVHRICKVQVTAFDPTMVRLQGFITNLTTLIGTSLYTRYLAPVINAIKSSTALPQDLVDKWKSITLAIATACANAIVGAFDGSFTLLDTKAQAILTWLVSTSGSSKGATVADKLFTALRQASDITVSDDFLKQFIASFCSKEWLSGKVPFQTAAPVGASNNFLTNLLIKAIQTLLDDALYNLLTQICSAVDTTDIQTCVQTNCAIIGQVVGKQFTTLLQTAAPINCDASSITIYRQNYDQIVQLIYEQIEAIIASGGDTTQFCQQDACDATVRQINTPPAGTDPAAYRNKIENTLSLEFASQFISLLLPDDRNVENGLTLTTPGVIILLNQLQLPASMQKVIQSILQWPESLFPSGPPAPVQTLLDSALYFFQKGLGGCITDQVNTGLGIGLNIGMNMVVPPDYLTMWMVQGAFPALFPALVKALLTISMQCAGDSMADQFKVLTQVPVDKATVYPPLLTYLQGKVQDMCKEVQFADIGITSEVFSEQVTPILDNITDYFIASSNGKNIDHHEIKKMLAQFSQPVNAGSNDVYGKLLTDLMFHLGNLQSLGNKKFSELVCQNFLEGIMSKTLTSAMAPLRTNEELIVGGILNRVGKTMSTQEQIDALLFNSPPQPVDMSEQLATQLSQISWMTYKIIDALIDQLPDDSNWFTSPFKKDGIKALKALMPSHSDLNTALAQVYGSVLGNRDCNESLYIKAVRIILASLQNASNLQ